MRQWAKEETNAKLQSKPTTHAPVCQKWLLYNCTRSGVLAVYVVRHHPCGLRVCFVLLFLFITMTWHDYYYRKLKKTWDEMGKIEDVVIDQRRAYRRAVKYVMHTQVALPSFLSHPSHCCSWWRSFFLLIDVIHVSLQIQGWRRQVSSSKRLVGCLSRIHWSWRRRSDE